MVRTVRVARARRVRVDAGGGGAHEPRPRDRDGVRDRLPGRRRRRRCAGGVIVRGRSRGRVALFLLVLPLAALPILVPHVDFLGESSLRGGYGALGDTGQSEVGDPLGSNGVWAAWPLGFAAAPGAYAGAVALACVLLAARARRLRTLVHRDRRARARRLRPHVPAARDAPAWFRALGARDPVRRRVPPQPRASPLRGRARAARPRRGGPARPRGAPAVPSRRERPGSAPRRSAFFVWPLLAGGSLVRFAMVARDPDGRALRSSTGWPPGDGDGPPRPRWSVVLAARASRERRLRTVLRGRHDLHRAGDGRSPEPRPTGPSLSHVGRSRVSRAHADRGAHASGARSLRDVGTPGGVLREGLPLDEVAGGLAGARTDEGHALRDPRRAGLQPRAAPPLLAIHPGDQRALGLLQRVGAQHAFRRGRPSAGSAVLGRPDGTGATRRGRDRGGGRRRTRSGSSTTHSRMATRAEDR